MNRKSIIQTEEEKKEFVGDCIDLTNDKIGEKWGVKLSTVSNYKHRWFEDITAEIKRRKNEVENVRRLAVLENPSNRLNPLFWQGYSQANMDDSSGKKIDVENLSGSLIYWSGYRQCVLDKVDSRGENKMGREIL